MSESTIKLFIVEDDLEFAEEIKNALNGSHNFDVKHYLTGDECVKNLFLNPDLVILDLNLPGLTGLELLKSIKGHNIQTKTIVLSGQDDVATVVNVYKSGADDYLVKNEGCWEELRNSTKILSTNISLQKEVEKLKEEVVDRSKYSSILGNSAPVLKVLKLVQKVEKSNILVLIAGESGTGKELVAKTIHYNSPRKNKPFVPVNVPAIPFDLIESELFGHEKGAFTGAVNKRIGMFEEANEGTIFLDEIGEMNLDLQSKLLRVLQENEVVRVGSNKIIGIEVRVLASTNRDLAFEVKEGRFREDLYYRLNGFLINLPPLNKRGDDVILLAKHFLKEFCDKNKLPQLQIDKSVIKMLLEYSWPGNIRELKSVMERAALLTDSPAISPDSIIFTQIVD